MHRNRLLIFAGLLVTFCVSSTEAAMPMDVGSGMAETFLLVQSINWLIIGVGLGFLIYNLCLAVFAREVLFLLNGLVLLTGMLILIWGDANLFRISDAPWLPSIYFAVAAVIAMTLLQQQFLRTYLETPDQHPRLDGVLKTCMLVVPLSLVATLFMPATQVLALTVTVYLAIQLADIALGLYVAGRGFDAARIYSVALLCTAVLWMCGLILPEVGGFNRVLLIHLFTKLGLVTQIVILSMGMGLCIYQTRQDSNRRLEMISRENEDLSKQNVQLQKVSQTDGLTQVGNRAHFDASFHMEWSRALREKSDLTLLLIDVDDFQKVNDSSGHPFGNQCLVEVAQAIRGCLHRAGDRVMRYGGEEFAALLVGTDAEGVPIVAERIRLAVKSLEIDECTLTVSIGGATIVPSADRKSSDFIELVDRALSAAKD